MTNYCRGEATGKTNIIFEKYNFPQAKLATTISH
jgi:hypothetical protein